MKRTILTGGVIGVVLLVYSMRQFGWRDVTAAFTSAGYGLLVLPVLHVVVTVANAQAWRLLNRSGCTLGLHVGARLLREAVNDLLPVANLGGNVAGAHALMRAGLVPVTAVAGVLADMTVEMAAQLAFTFLGILVLIIYTGQLNVVTVSAGAGCLFIALGLSAFVMAQRGGLLNWLESAIEGFASTLGWSTAGQFTELHSRVHAIYADRLTLFRSFVLHLTAWAGTTFETWLAFRLLQIDQGIAEAVILESLGQAIRSAAFIVPGALGVQEGGYIVLGGLLGISGNVALALSLLRRSREILLGVPVILGRLIHAHAYRSKS